MNNRLDAVWLIWTGEFEDRRILAAYPTEELADSALSQFTDEELSDDRIEKERLSVLSEARRHPYQCLMCPDGTRHRIDTDEKELAPVPEPFISGYGDNDGPRLNGFWAYGTSPEEALNNCEEFRVKWLAENPDFPWWHPAAQVPPGGGDKR